MTPTRRVERRRGQAVIETALVIPLMLAMIFNYLAIMVQVVTQQELNSAVSLAAASTLDAPLGQGSAARADAAESFNGTFTKPSFATAPNLSCSDGGGGYLEGVVNIAKPIVCTATTTLNFGQSPVGFAVFWTPTLTARAAVYPSPNRECLPPFTSSTTAC